MGTPIYNLPYPTDYTGIADVPEWLKDLADATEDALGNKADTSDLEDKQDKSNLVTSLSSSSTDTEYPSAKCVYDGLEEKQDKSNRATLVEDTTFKAILHRGAYTLAPENTIPAFKIAAEKCCWGIETDIQKTNDGKFICMHDGTVDRTTDGTGNVADLTLSQIQALNIDAGSYIEDYTNLKVPTFEEYLNVCYQYNVIPVIELKSETLGTSDIDDILEIIKQYGFEKKCVVISFGLSLLQELRRLSSSVNIQYLVGNCTQANIDTCVSNKFNGIDTNSITSELVEYSHQNGIEVNLWTITSGIDNNSINMRYDYYTTNDMRYLIAPSLCIYKRNGITAKNELEKKELINAKDFNGSLDNFFITPLLTPATLETAFLNRAFVWDRAICIDKIRLEPNCVINYNIPSGYTFTIRCFDGDGNQFADLGWFTGTSKKITYSTVKYGFAYIGRSQTITDNDLKDLKNIITSIEYPDNHYATIGVEIPVGTWVDGKTIYRKVLELDPSWFGDGSASAGVSLTISHGISNLDVMTECKLMWKRTAEAQRRIFPSVFFGNTGWNGQIFANNSNLLIELGTNILNQLAVNSSYIYVILEYTKTS